MGDQMRFNIAMIFMSYFGFCLLFFLCSKKTIKQYAKCVFSHFQMQREAVSDICGLLFRRHLDNKIY